MKFAIRKLAITCVLPAALWQGPLMSDAFAQNPFPTANSKMNADRPQKRPVTNKKAPPAKQQAPANNTQPQYPAAQLPAGNNPAPVYQVANPSAQFQPQQINQEAQGNQEGPETDVQRQLRLLYEKSGREMPEMDLSEMEVPEPQPGVAPNGPAGATQMPGQFAQPPVPPQKNPNFFERVFLGKKAPPRQAPQPRGPLAPQPRPIVPNGMQPGTLPATNYRPYQPGQQPQPGQQVPQGYNGQRPGVPNQPATTPQPNPQQHQQQAPQVMLQRPVGQPQVIPAPQPGVQAQPQNSVVPPQQIQTPAQFNPQPTGGGVPQANQQEQDDVPLLDEEPEESLEIDLNPKPAAQPQGNATPVITPSQGAAAPSPTAKETFISEPATPATPADPAPASENPFSGLRLSIPEAAVPTPRARNTPAAVPAQTPAAGSAQTPSASPAANATLPSNPATPPAATVLPGKDNPFLDDEDLEEKEETDAFAEPAKPLTPPAAQDAAPPAAMLVPSATRSFEIAPIQPPETTTPRTNKRVGPAAKAVDQPVATKTPLSAADERLKKLADAPEKTGLKGFCPVALRQKGQLIESKPQFNATYRGQKFHFSSIAAKAAFEKEPQLFSPMHGGLDGVALLDSEKSLPGSLDHAVWYQGQLYLFASAQNREAFVNDPDSFLDHGETKPKVTRTALGPGKAARPTKPQAAPPAAIPAKVTVQPAAQATPQLTAPDDDLPVLSDDLEDLEDLKLTPVTSNPTVPATQGTPSKIPTLTPVDAGKEGSTTRDAPAPVTPKAKVTNPPAVAPPTLQPGPQLELPMLKKATKNTPASFVAPSTPSRSTATPPRLISPDLKLAPPVRQ